MVDILGKSQVSVDKAIYWSVVRGAGYQFSNLARLYWVYSPPTGVRPEVAWAQACHETGFGRYGRAVTPEHNNYCGLKVTNPVGPDDNPDDHARFPTPEVGIQAHLDHLALYAGAPGYPRNDTADGRHFPYLIGRAKGQVEGLSGSWAPAKTYHEPILRNLNEMILAQ